MWTTVHCILLRRVASPHIVLPLSVCSVHGVRLAVQAGGHLEGLDELGCSHATCTLRHNARKAHLPLQVELKLWKENRH